MRLVENWAEMWPWSKRKEKKSKQQQSIINDKLKIDGKSKNTCNI